MSKITDTHMLYTVTNETQETRKEVEGLKELLNTGWDVMTSFTYKEEIYYLLYNHAHEEELVN